MAIDQRERPREWRRSVMVPARMRCASGWGDARILNLSSRGLMIHAAHTADLGDLIELRKGNQMIVAKVVWKRDPRSGLQSDTLLPLFDLLSQSEPAAGPDPERALERRQAPRTHPRHDAEFHRTRARLFEGFSMGAIAIALSLSLAVALGGAIGDKFATIDAALSE